MKNAIRLTVFSMIIFSLMSYWGIRSPDSEVVFRTTQALVRNGTFAISEELEWKGFGISEGKDGNRYSIFGPGEAVAAIPFYMLAECINDTDWYQAANGFVSKSFYVNEGLSCFMYRLPQEDIEPHALRMTASLFNIIIASICVFIFFLTIKALTRSEPAALMTSILFAFGSLIFPYSGTFFSEILATLFVMLAFYMLVHVKLINSTSAPLSCS